MKWIYACNCYVFIEIFKVIKNINSIISAFCDILLISNVRLEILYMVCGLSVNFRRSNSMDEAIAEYLDTYSGCWSDSSTFWEIRCVPTCIHSDEMTYINCISINPIISYNRKMYIDHIIWLGASRNTSPFPKCWTIPLIQSFWLTALNGKLLSHPPVLLLFLSLVHLVEYWLALPMLLVGLILFPP